MNAAAGAENDDRMEKCPTLVRGLFNKTLLLLDHTDASLLVRKSGLRATRRSAMPIFGLAPLRPKFAPITLTQTLPLVEMAAPTENTTDPAIKNENRCVALLETP
jgi:hypothetical protein